MKTDTSPSSTPTSTPQTGNREWFARLPNDWSSWLDFRQQVIESPRTREALRDAMAAHLDETAHGLQLGLGYFACGEPGRALPFLQAADGDLPAFLAGLAQRSTGDRSGALATFTRLTGSKAVGARAALALAELHYWSRDAEGLAADAKTLGGAGGTDADKAFVEGLQSELEGEHEASLASWQRALESDPTHVEATFHLARLLDLFGDDDSALDLLCGFRTGALPAHTGALTNLGILYEDREQHDWARTCFRMVVAADPTNVRARRYLSDANASLDQYYDESRERRADKHNAVLRIPVTDFELSVRARNCLQKMSIHTLGDLVSRTESDLLSFKNFGETSLQEVKEILQAKGLRLGMLPASIEDISPIEAVASAHEGDVRDVLISELDLSVRSRAALATLGITRVGELAETTETTLLSCKNFGQTSLDEIRSKLRQLGLDLTG